MGKHKHSKDKLYILQSEYRRNAINKKHHKSQNLGHLPFNYCCISLRPFNEPYCDENGKLYDKKSVLEEMEKSKKSGKVKDSINLNNLIKANFYKHNNEYICPITRKYFNRHSKIILNKKTGNVYSSEIFKLFKNKNEMFDPISHEPMSKSDLLVLQDSLDNKTKQNGIDKKNASCKSAVQSIQDNGAIMSILEEVRNKKTENEKSKNDKKKNWKDEENNKNDQKQNKKDEEYNKNSCIHNKEEQNNQIQLKKTETASPYDSESSENELKIKCKNYSDNKLAQSVTSTIYNPTYKNEFIYLPESQVCDIIYEKVHKKKKNSYVRLITDVGMINIELYASIYPKLCHNFLYLCEYKYYNKTDIFKKDQNIVYFGSSKNKFHNAASGFYWKKKIKKKHLRNKLNDQVKIDSLKEYIIGINSDNDSDLDIKYIKYNDNKHIGEDYCFGNIYFFKYYNQKYSNMFYICLSECYTTNDICIGKVVGGNETLMKLKNLYPKSNDIPHSLNETIIYTNPFKEVIKEMKKKLKNEENQKDTKENIESLIDDENFVENKNDNVGKYINWKEIKKSSKIINDDEPNQSKLNMLRNQTNAKLSKMSFSFW